MLSMFVEVPRTEHTDVQSGWREISELTGGQFIQNPVGRSIYLVLCNKTPQTWGLKHLIACKSVVWVGFSQDGSLLLHIVSTGAIGWGPGEFQDDSYTWLIGWCWVLAGNSEKAVLLSLGFLDSLIVVAGSHEFKTEAHSVFMTKSQKSHSVTYPTTLLIQSHKVPPSFKRKGHRLHLFTGEQQYSRRTCGTGDVVVAPLENKTCHIGHGKIFEFSVLW